MTEPLPDLSRLCIHTITTKPWSLVEAAEAYAKAGVKGITVWRDALGPHSPSEAKTILANNGLAVVSLCRGGFFPSVEAKKRQEAIDENRKIIDEAAELGAPLIVLVCGAEPQQSLADSRKQIADGIREVLPYAKERGVKLGIEPLHPMYADTRSAVNTIGQANEMAEEIGDENIGVVVDIYHLWWDPALEAEIARCGNNDNLFAFHVCDWRVPTEDILLDRGLMGEGCIPVRKIRGWAEAAGFAGFHEVEIFSKRHWARDQQEFLDDIVKAYRNHV